MYHKENDKPKCCKEGDSFIYFHVNESNSEDGFEGFTGWGIRIDVNQDGEATYIPISYCPFCGKKLM